MASVASEMIQKVTAHAQSDSLEDAREICADGIYFPNNLCKIGCNFKLNILYIGLMKRGRLMLVKKTVVENGATFP